MPRPTEIRLQQNSRQLVLGFDDNFSCSLSCEFLRVHSPSAEVRGHGPGQETLQVGKEQVNITAIEPVGNYGVKLVFDDGHDSGIYNWDYLYELGQQQDAYWANYLQRLADAGHQRAI
ncbi:MAG: gamma-butyrobetaine hydroxylase-like domain-containing protein [Granulosicoccaceae bacterium]